MINNSINNAMWNFGTQKEKHVEFILSLVKWDILFNQKKYKMRQKNIKWDKCYMTSTEICFFR